MNKKIQKIFRGKVKSFDEKTHTATIMISTGDIDRDREIIEPKAFQKNLGNYMAHPILLSSHRAETLTRQIGEAKAIRITDDGVEGDYEWYAGKIGPDGRSMNPEADWGWFLVTRGIAAFSVGFMPVAWLDKWSQPMISQEDSARGIARRYTEIELFENSQVLIPANPNAVQRRMDEAEGEEKELLELATKELKAEEIEPFKKAEEEAEKKRYEESRDKFLAWFKDPVVKEQIEKLFDERLQEALKDLKRPKHYSEILLDAGANGLKQTSTGDQTDDDEDDEEQSPIQNKDALIGAIREGIQEAIK